jgi:hypothetical protein
MLTTVKSKVFVKANYVGFKKCTLTFLYVRSIREEILYYFLELYANVSLSPVYLFPELCMLSAEKHDALQTCLKSSS